MEAHHFIRDLLLGPHRADAPAEGRGDADKKSQLDDVQFLLGHKFPSLSSFEEMMDGNFSFYTCAQIFSTGRARKVSG